MRRFAVRCAIVLVGLGAAAATALAQDAPDAHDTDPYARHLRTALEIVGFEGVLNAFDRTYFGCCDFNTSAASVRRNLRGPWRVDRDSFTINQLGHPYQGSMYHTLARANGLGYWPSAAFTFAGSALWEIAGETTQPSRNDQIATGIGGAFLGEALFRTAHLWLERGFGPSAFRETVAAAISPAVGYHRLALRDASSHGFESHDPAYETRLDVGLARASESRRGSDGPIERREGIVRYALEYGLPGRAGYTYDRPFDYYALQVAASSALGIERLATWGTLWAAPFGAGQGSRVDGIAGVYGSYDYLVPQVFRLASTAVSLGTTAAWRASDEVMLRGTALAGVGYATVSTVGGLADERANSYGTAPQGTLALQLRLGSRWRLDASAHAYFVGGVADEGAAHDDVVHADAALTWRVHGPHALSLRYQYDRRRLHGGAFGDRIASRATVGIYYSLL